MRDDSKLHFKFLLCLVTWITVYGSEPGQAPSDELSWFVHISDTHFSDFVPKREADLSAFVQRELPGFEVSHVLMTGDLVDGKRKSRRSQQRIGEWEQYQRMVQHAHASLGTSNETFIDIRGNHDAFDTALRNGERDFYRRYGVQGDSWSQGRILIHPTVASGSCPRYCLIGVDLAPEIGLRSPTNFFGQVNQGILNEFEKRVIEDMRQRFAQGCDPVYIAYGHYPLSTVGEESYLFVGNQHKLKRMLLKYGIHAWLCGHLHDEFGNHLHRLHRGEVSTLLELEVADWKFERRFRIVAVDHRQLSFMDFQWIAESDLESRIEALDADAKIEGAIVMITFPSSPYFTPLGNSRGDAPLTTVIRALVWPLDAAWQASASVVTAAFYCKNSQEPFKTLPMNASENRYLYEVSMDSVPKANDCDHVFIQIHAQFPGDDGISRSEKRWFEQTEKAQEYPHGFFEALVLAYPWYSVFQNLFVSMILFHVTVLLLLPKLLSYTKPFLLKEESLDDAANGNENGHMKHKRCMDLFLAPIRALVTASRSKVFWWGQMSFALLMLFGPWSFARVLSQRPMGIMFIPTVHVKHTTSSFESVFAPEMPFRACFFYIFVVFPSTFWLVWTLNRCVAKGNGSNKTRKWVTVLYIMAAILPLVCFIYSLYVSWLFYGPLCVFLSPVFVVCVLVNGCTILSGLRSIPKFRQE